MEPTEARVMQLKEALKSVRAHFTVSKMIQKGKYDCDVNGHFTEIIDKVLDSQESEADFLRLLRAWEKDNKEHTRIISMFYRNPLKATWFAWRNFILRKKNNKG